MSTEELLKSIQLVHASLKFLDAVENLSTEVSAPIETQAMTVKQAFAKKDKVFCMICGKGFITLKRHLTVAHGLKPAEYKKQFGIKSTQTLAAKSYVESRRQTAIDMNLGDGLAKARATRKANADKKQSNLPVLKTKAPVPMKLEATKAQVPAVKKKAAVPMKVEIAKAPVKASKKTVAPVKTAKKK
jgi:predicted transcriptional regulator